MRLIDLRCHWYRQYFPELTGFNDAADADVSGRLGELEGYLSETSASVLHCSRSPEAWASVSEPWGMLSDLIARYQAEFSGRILMVPDDAARWRAEPEGHLCWGLIGVAGFDFLIRIADDLERLPTAFARGVRLFQPVASRHSLLGGSSEPGDDRGLSDLGKEFLERVGRLCDVPAPSSPRPILDLHGMNDRTRLDVLDWFEADPGRSVRIIPIVSHAAVAHPHALGDSSSLVSLNVIARLRELGGVIGLGVRAPCVVSPEDLTGQVEFLRTIPFRGEHGVGGIAIGTGFLGSGQPLHAFKNAEAIEGWLRRTFDSVTAARLIHGNARELLLRAVGSSDAVPAISAG